MSGLLCKTWSWSLSLARLGLSFGSNLDGTMLLKDTKGIYIYIKSSSLLKSVHTVSTTARGSICGRNEHQKALAAKCKAARCCGWSYLSPERLAREEASLTKHHGRQVLAGSKQVGKGALLNCGATCYKFTSGFGLTLGLCILLLVSCFQHLEGVDQLEWMTLTIPNFYAYVLDNTQGMLSTCSSHSMKFDCG